MIDYPSLYNALLDHSSLKTLGAIVSTPHLAMKFPVSAIKVRVVHVDQKEA